MTTFPYFTPSSNCRPWDDGIRTHWEDDGPDWSLDPLGLSFVRDQHLRAANGDAEDQYIDWLIRTSLRQAEQFTNRALIPREFRLVMSAFPWGHIYLPKAPLISVSSIDYVDSGGVPAELTGSPASFTVITPGGNQRGYIQPLYGASWPSAYGQDDAVTVTFTAGYPIVDGVAGIPEDITDGRLLWIGERYKQRSLTDNAGSQNKASIQARTMWMGHRVY